MKKEKNIIIISIFNLALFLVSFTFSSYNSLAKVPSLQDHFHKQIASRHDTTEDNSLQQCYSEKNETEKDFVAPIFDLSAIVSLFQLEVSQISLSVAEPLAEDTTNPIYIRIHNFRI